MTKKQLLLAVLIFIALLPLWMWLAWLVTPKTKLVVAIIDKTVLTSQGQEHKSLNWILNNQRYTKTHQKGYQTDHDYFGFFPLENEKYKLKGLERFSVTQLQQLSVDADMAYVTDTYGIYKNEWYTGKGSTERSGMLYGGMTANDIVFLRNMKARHKLTVAEFNSIGSPTTPVVRAEFENLFAMHWSGWTARYFDSFDTVRNKELPKWLTNSYKREHNQQWPFHKSGIAFVSDNDRVAILEEGTDLTDAVPHILTGAYGQNKLGLPERMKYPFWFDIIIPNEAVNQVVSKFDIGVNAKGRAELKKYGIPLNFPAVLMHRGTDYKFYYFSGDFCDNPINATTSYFKGIHYFKWLFYNEDDIIERNSFFWKFYRPLMQNILNDDVSLKTK
jgi:hypothetical protein